MATNTPIITINVPQQQPVQLPSAHQRTPSMTPRTTPIPHSPTASKKLTPPRISTPTSATAPLTTWSSSFNPRSCYLCDEQNPGDFSPTTKFLEICLLCSRDFCPIHSRAAALAATSTTITPHELNDILGSPTTTTTTTAATTTNTTSPASPVGQQASANNNNNVCNINHSQYYHECLEQARQQVAQRKKATPTTITDSDILTEAEETLLKDGIFPSVGERERMLWKTSPISTARMAEIENFRSLAAELEGTKDRRSSALIETKELVGADIAV